MFHPKSCFHAFLNSASLFFLTEFLLILLLSNIELEASWFCLGMEIMEKQFLGRLSGTPGPSCCCGARISRRKTAAKTKTVRHPTCCGARFLWVKRQFYRLSSCPNLSWKKYPFNWKRTMILRRSDLEIPGMLDFLRLGAPPRLLVYK